MVRKWDEMSLLRDREMTSKHDVSGVTNHAITDIFLQNAHTKKTKIVKSRESKTIKNEEERIKRNFRGRRKPYKPRRT